MYGRLTQQAYRKCHRKGRGIQRYNKHSDVEGDKGKPKGEWLPWCPYARLMICCAHCRLTCSRVSCGLLMEYEEGCDMVTTNKRLKCHYREPRWGAKQVSGACSRLRSESDCPLHRVIIILGWLIGFFTRQPFAVRHSRYSSRCYFNSAFQMATD